MKPKHPLTQAFNELPSDLPLYQVEHALLPDGELPLELASPTDFALFISALRTDQLIGIVQPNHKQGSMFKTGCAGRIRQYRERKDGRLNIMLTGLCRFRITEQTSHQDGYITGKVDWSDFENDYSSESVNPMIIDTFKTTLRNYFIRHNMQVDWDTLNKQEPERMINNLVLIINLDTDSKQQLMEAPTLTARTVLFTELLSNKSDPIIATAPTSKQ